jgi:dienelactone hydrolase
MLRRRTRRRQRSSRSWAAPACLGAGTLLLGIGVGIGLPHARKTGWSWLTLAGLSALVVGLLVAAYGAVSLTRRVRGWRRLVVGPAVVVVPAVLVYLVAVPLAVTVVPRTPPGRAPSALGLAHRDVTVRTVDGIDLSAWYLPPADLPAAGSNTPSPAVVVLHGAGSNKSAALGQAAVLVRHGYVALLLDARGHGASGGRAMDWGWFGDADVDAAVTFLGSLPQVDPSRIAVLGLSMGGEEAIGAAGADRRIRAVVAEGATGRTGADLRWLSDVYGWRGTVQEALHSVQQGLVDVLTDGPPPRTLAASAADAAPRPILLVTAGQRVDELHAASRIRRAAGANVQVWTVPGSDHTAGLRTSPQEWERRVIAFLDAATG